MEQVAGQGTVLCIVPTKKDAGLIGLVFQTFETAGLFDNSPLLPYTIIGIRLRITMMEA